MRAADGEDSFSGKPLTDAEKAALIQRNFDAVVYVKVVEKGLTEEPVPGVTHQGGTLVFYKQWLPGFASTFSTDIGANRYILKPDGSVWEPMLALKTQVDLQDTHTNKVVWSSETIASGNPTETTLPQLFDQASKQMVAKLHEDHVI